MTLRRRKQSDSIQATLDLLVLKTLSRSPQHGYGIARHIEAVTDDVLKVEEGSLYPALHRMEQSGWIVAEWKQTPNNRRARMYRITRDGRKQLTRAEQHWTQLTQAIGKLLRFA